MSRNEQCVRCKHAQMFHDATGGCAPHDGPFGPYQECSCPRFVTSDDEDYAEILRLRAMVKR